MPLTMEQEQLEHELRVEQMTPIDVARVNIEKMPADVEKAQRDARLETWKVVISVVVGAAACIGAGVALANHVNGRAPATAQPPPLVIYVLPGQTPPAAAAPPR